jgi:hypothetical protein
LRRGETSICKLTELTGWSSLDRKRDTRSPATNRRALKQSIDEPAENLYDRAAAGPHQCQPPRFRRAGAKLAAVAGVGTRESQ